MKHKLPPGYVARGHVICLDPTVKQAQAMQRAAGVNRFTYNWGLAEWTRQYKTGEKPTAANLRKQFNTIKREQFSWVYESPRDANSQAFADLNQAFQNFFASCSGKRKGPKIKYPQFKKKGIHDSFYVANDKFSMRRRGKRGVVRLPVIGDVRTFEHLRFRGKIMSGRVFRGADKWFIAVNIQVPIEDVRRVSEHQYKTTGVDLGLKTAVFPSHGDPVDAPKPLKKNLKKLRRANRVLHRRVKGSNNRMKARTRVARLHQRIANIRKDFWHKVTTQLCRENQTVVIEDLALSFMLRNRKTSRAASDVGLGGFRQKLLYKAPVHGSKVIVADRFFPSTQRCSRCGHIKTGEKKLAWGDSVYVCEVCAFVEDRDRNGSLNLEQYPGLLGNWGCKAQTPMDDCASTQPAIAGCASAVDEVGTNPCSHMSTL